MSDNLIRASEIAEYVYCRRGWWLKRIGGYRSSYVREMAAGRQYHADHGRLARRSQRARRLALTCLFVALLLMSYWLVQLW